MNISDLGLEIIKHPITHVRVQPHGSRWYVEYRRKPKYVLDRWWWFNDGLFVEYTTAKARAIELQDCGYYSKIQYRREVFVPLPLREMD